MAVLDFFSFSLPTPPGAQVGGLVKRKGFSWGDWASMYNRGAATLTYVEGGHTRTSKFTWPVSPDPTTAQPAPTTTQAPAPLDTPTTTTPVEVTPTPTPPPSETTEATSSKQAVTKNHSDLGAATTFTTSTSTRSGNASQKLTVSDNTATLLASKGSTMTTSSTLHFLPAPTLSSTDTISGTNNPQSASGTSHRSKTGPIVGGVIGALLFLVILSVTSLVLLRRRRRNHVAPSAEFADYAQRHGSLLATYRWRRRSGRSFKSLNSAQDLPPPFEKGGYKDPLFEKVHQTRKANIAYGLAI